MLESLTNNGWLKGEPRSYNRALGLYSEDVVAFYREAFPDEWAAYRARYPVNTEGTLLKSVARGLDKDGALSVLRHGFKDRGARVRLAQFKPDHGLRYLDALPRRCPPCRPRCRARLQPDGVLPKEEVVVDET